MGIGSFLCLATVPAWEAEGRRREALRVGAYRCSGQLSRPSSFASRLLAYRSVSITLLLVSSSHHPASVILKRPASMQVPPPHRRS